jgi:hypothetical protein
MLAALRERFRNWRTARTERKAEEGDLDRLSRSRPQQRRGRVAGAALLDREGERREHAHTAEELDSGISSEVGGTVGGRPRPPQRAGKHHVDAHEPAGTLDVEADPQALGSFDEHRRGRPGN